MACEYSKANHSDLDLYSITFTCGNEKKRKIRQTLNWLQLVDGVAVLVTLYLHFIQAFDVCIAQGNMS